VNRNFNTGLVRAAVRRIAASVAAAVLVFLLAIGATAQHNNGRQNSPRTEHSRPSQPRERQQPQRPQPQIRQNQNQQRQNGNRSMPVRPATGPEYSQPRGQSPNMVRPAFGADEQRNTPSDQRAPRQPYQSPRPVSPNTQTVRPALPGFQPRSTNPGASHLGSWLNQHSNLPEQGQQQLLRNDPSFKNLPQSDQQRLMRQLQQVNKMPEQERQRRLDRAERIERMSPQERMQLNQSTRQLSTLPSDRQSMVRRAFRDLRGVPPDQRQTVLNSQRYQGQFSPEERGILGNLLRAEPYQPQQ